VSDLGPRTPGHTATAPARPSHRAGDRQPVPDRLGISLGDQRPHVSGKIREYLPLPAPTQLSVVFSAPTTEGALDPDPGRSRRPGTDARWRALRATRSARPRAGSGPAIASRPQLRSGSRSSRLTSAAPYAAARTPAGRWVNYWFSGTFDAFLFSWTMRRRPSVVAGDPVSLCHT
jgi:hypothetical protein